MGTEWWKSTNTFIRTKYANNAQGFQGLLARTPAFKPVVTSSTPVSMAETSEYTNIPISCQTPRSCDDGYGTHELHRLRSHSNSVNSHEADIYASPRPARDRLSAASVAASVDNCRHNVCDKPVAAIDYEKLLREKEAEMARVRETMELNESAILQVQERKRIDWENQMRDLSQEYQRHLKLSHDQSVSREDELRDRVERLEAENGKLQGELTVSRSGQLQSRDLSERLERLHQQNDSLSQRLAQCGQERARLDDRVRELEAHNRKLSKQLETGEQLRKQLERNVCELQRQLHGPAASAANKGRLEQLQQQLDEQDRRLERERLAFGEERDKWQQEKVKVLQYQNQLQQTYVQMYRRNRQLEQQLCRGSVTRASRHRTGRDSVSSWQSVLNAELDSSPESFC